MLINIFLVDDKSVILYIILDLNKDVKTTLPAYEESGARDIAFYFTDLDLGPVSPSPANCKGPNLLLFFVLLHEKNPISTVHIYACSLLNHIPCIA